MLLQLQSFQWSECHAPVEPSPNWSECLVGFLAGSQTNLPSDFIWHDFTTHHPFGRRESHGFFVSGAPKSHRFAILFFFSNECLEAQKELMGKWRNSRSEVRAEGCASAKGGQAVPLIEGFFVFSQDPQDQWWLLITYLLIIFRWSVWVLGELYPIHKTRETHPAFWHPICCWKRLFHLPGLLGCCWVVGGPPIRISRWIHSFEGGGPFGTRWMSWWYLMVVIWMMELMISVLVRLHLFSSTIHRVGHHQFLVWLVSPIQLCLWWFWASSADSRDVNRHSPEFRCASPTNSARTEVSAAFWEYRKLPAFFVHFSKGEKNTASDPAQRIWFFFNEANFISKQSESRFLFLVKSVREIFATLLPLK